MDKAFSKFLLFSLGVTFGVTSVVSQISEGGTPASFVFQDEVQLRSAKFPFISPINFDIAKLLVEDKMAEEAGVLLRTSVIIPVDLTMENAGEWIVLPDGTNIWRLTVQAPGAIAIMLYYDRFFIPDGGKLFIYNADHTHLLGAYTSSTNPGDGKFATEFVAGDEIILEYNEPPSPDEMKPDIRISGIGYGYNYLEVYQSEGLLGGIEGTFEQSCQVNINCPEGNNWQDQKKGVAKSVAPFGNSAYLCSGTVLNNTAQDLTPYYLSAHHCWDDPKIEFNQIVFYFHYESEGCETTTPAGTRTIVGAQMLVDLSINGSSDGALLKLNSDIPKDYGVYYNGWDRRNTPATSGAGIHHPKGDIKKIATFTSAVTSGQWTGQYGPGADNAHWNVNFTKTQSGYGQTEGGSSGSPLFNQAGLVVGTLTGGSAANCTRGSSSWYGKLWYHWNNANSVAGSTKTMKDYLDPLNTGRETLNGIYNAVAGNTDLAALTVVPGALVPAFSPFQTVYTVQVAENVEVIEVSATVANAGATVTGTGNHQLTIGNNTIRITVTAPDRASSKTYTLTVNRSQQTAPDRFEPNNTLEQAYSLPVSFSNDAASVKTTGSNFHNETDIDYYKVDLPSGNNYTFSALLYDLHNNDDNKTYTVDATFAYSTNGRDWSDEFDDLMQGNVAITNGGTVYFRVIPYFEGDMGDYLLEIDIDRKQAGNSNNTNLSALSIDPGNLNFLSGWTLYSVYVAYSVQGVVIEATAADANATISGIGYHNIEIGTTSIPVIVTAPNGTTRRTYTITVLRRTTANNNAALQSLAVTPGILSPRFNVNIPSYNVNVANTVNRINVSATAADAYASVEGAGEHLLEMGNNAIDIVVVAENGSNMRTYSINVTRGVVGMEDNIHQSPVIAYPNPATNQITISGLSGSGILSLFDAVGKERLRQTITSTQEIITVNSLPSGIYLIRITESEKTSTLKVIVN